MAKIATFLIVSRQKKNRRSKKRAEREAQRNIYKKNKKGLYKYKPQMNAILYTMLHGVPPATKAYRTQCLISIGHASYSVHNIVPSFFGCLDFISLSHLKILPRIMMHVNPRSTFYTF